MSKGLGLGLQGSWFRVWGRMDAQKNCVGCRLAFWGTGG